MTFTNIEWADRVWNPTSGCLKVSHGCKHCYADREWNIRHRHNPNHIAYGRDFSDIQVHPARLAAPFAWRRPVRIFVDSISDLFQDEIPLEFVAAVFGTIALAPEHTFQILTKRPQRMRAFFEWLALEGRRTSPAAVCVMQLLRHAVALPKHVAARLDWPTIDAMAWPLPNVWLGISAENQNALDARLPELLATPAAVHWISAEPLLSALTVPAPVPGQASVKWIVAGGESGPKARFAHPDWLRQLRDFSVQHHIPFNLKQLGEFVVPEDGAEACRVCGCTWHNACPGSCWWVEPGLCSSCVGQEPSGTDRPVRPVRVGRRKAGRLLDGVLWDQYPAPAGATNT